jgi:ribonuclease HII
MGLGWYTERNVHFLAGVDEAGRGPLAGPVVAAVVVLQDGQIIEGVRDSKKLSARRREELFAGIKSEAVDWALGIADVAEIDRLNILGATMLAMQRAIAGLSVTPQSLQIDGNQRPELPDELDRITQTLVGGDDICPAIGAASIIAKVERDRMMGELHNQYPGYGFDRHKGYPTVAHRQALIDLGVTPVHRMSFRPVREAAEAAGLR